jgi:uncharacterized protein with von Willebrand factor type A (vWA) domain
MIPSKFNILNHVIEVIYDNEYCNKNECFAQFFPNENKIILADKYKTKNGWRKYKQEIIDHVFYHELTHCILYYMNHELWDNENFVDQFSGLLAQALERKE